MSNTDSTDRGMEVFDHGDLGLSDQERELVVLARKLAYERFAPRASRYDRENAFPTENFEDLKKHGLMDLTVPRQYGGKGLSGAAYAAVMLEIAKGDPPTALCFTMHTTAMILIDQLGSAEQKERFFGRVVRDHLTVSALGSEPDANIFAGKPPRTLLTRTDGGYLLTGRKAWCSLGPNAQLSFVNAQLDGMTVAVMVPLDAPNLRAHHDWDTLAMRGTQSMSMDFEGVFIPEGDVIATPLNLFLELEYGVGLCASYLGVAEMAYRHARDLVRKSARRQVESELGHDHPDAGRLFTTIGEMRIALEPAWLMLVRAARTGPIGSLQRTWRLAEAKYVIGETAARVTSQALRVVGAKALSRSYPIERLFRDAQAGLVMAIKPDNAAYLAGRFELGILPTGLLGGAAPTTLPISDPGSPGQASGQPPGQTPGQDNHDR